MGLPVIEGDFVPPATQKVIVADNDGQVIVWDNGPVSVMTPDSIYIKTDAVAINPSDTKMVGDFQTPFTVMGLDYAGTVVAVGSNVKGVAIGDRITAGGHEMNKLLPDRGAFKEYNATKGDIWMKIPPSMSTEAGASLMTGVCTAGLAMRSLGLPIPGTLVDKPRKILVYGGSTATGTLAIQLLRLVGLIPIATCSPKNFELVKSYGAEEVFDYHQPSTAQTIRNLTKNNLDLALDCINTVESTTFCYAALGRAGGRYTSIDPIAEHAASRKAIKAEWVLGISIFGEEVAWPAPYGRPGSPELAAFGTEYLTALQKLLDQGRIRNHPIRVMEGDIGTVLEGIELLKSGVISGEKIVVKFK